MFAVAVIQIIILIIVGSIKAEDLIGLHQDDPLLIKTIQEKFLTFHKEGSTYNLSTNPKLDGQFGQADTIEKLFRGKKNGFFVEAGAFDGEAFSNTLLFELKHNWTGLLVEPNPDLYQGQAHDIFFTNFPKTTPRIFSTKYYVTLKTEKKVHFLKIKESVLLQLRNIVETKKIVDSYLESS